MTTWPHCQYPVRVVRSRETCRVRGQLNGQIEQVTSDWIRVSTLHPLQASTATVIQIGHWRWRIENQGLNDLASRWHADHVYKRQANAILAFWLLASIAHNLFTTFYHRDLKPVVRKAYDSLQIARLIITELYAALPIHHRGL